MAEDKVFQKALNIAVNFGVITLSYFFDGFDASAISLKKISPIMKKKVMELRQKAYGAAEENKKILQKRLTDEFCQEGIAIVEKYSFGSLSKLTEKLSDEEIAMYAVLYDKEDNSFTKMFDELTPWIKAKEIKELFDGLSKK